MRAPALACLAIVLLTPLVTASCGGRTTSAAVDEPSSKIPSSPSATTAPATTSMCGPGSKCASAPTPICTPSTCGALGMACGVASDGCGGVLDCGTCGPADAGASTKTTGDASAPPDDGGICVPRTCPVAWTCAPVPDGCGGILTCGACGPGLVCQGDSCLPETSADDACVPLTCAQAGVSCGQTPDGCGNILNCGLCSNPCPSNGNGGLADSGPAPVDAGPQGNGGQCAPTTCARQGILCGLAGDGCGAELFCGCCSAPLTCGGADAGYGRCG